MNIRISIVSMAFAAAISVPVISTAQGIQNGGAQFAAMPQAAFVIDEGAARAITNPTGGIGGAPISEVTLPNTALGENMNFAANVWLAESFTVPASGATLNRARFYGYQTNSTTTSTFTTMKLRLYSGALTTTPIFGDGSTNLMTSTTFSGFYRVSSTTPTNSARPVMEIVADFPVPVVLPAGDYWLSWSATGSLASGPFTPPQVVNAEPTCQKSIDGGATFAPSMDTGSATQLGCLFVIEGTTPEVDLIFADNFEAIPVRAPDATRAN